MENRANRLPTTQDIKKEFSKFIAPISLSLILALSSGVKPANAQEIQNAVNSSGENTTSYTVSAQDGVDLAVEDVQACTYQVNTELGTEWRARYFFNTANESTVSTDESNTLAMFNTDLPGVSGPPNIGVYHKIPALDPGEVSSVKNEIILDYSCDNGSCPDTTTATFSAGAPPRVETNYDNNVLRMATSKCAPEKKMHLPLVLR